MPPRILNCRMKGRECLHEHVALHVATSCASAHLREQLKRALARAKVRHVQAEIGIHDAHQGDIRKVESLGDHLGAHQDVDLPGPEIPQHSTIVILAFEGIRIHSRDACVGEEFVERGLHLLGAESGVADVWIAAGGFGTELRGGSAVAADMTSKHALGAVEGERDAAVRTPGDVAAFRTLQRGGIATSVEKEHHLFLPLESRLDCVLQLQRENRRALLLARLISHVDHPNQRQLAIINASGHLEQGVFAPFCIGVALHRGSGRSQHHDGAFALRAHDRNIAGMIARGLFLLVGMLVFLVHDDQSERVDGCEDGRSRTDHDTRPSLANLVPFVVALSARKMAM